MMQPGMMPTTETERAAPEQDDPRLQRVLTEMEARFGTRSYALWCENRIRPSIADDTLTIAVGSPFLLSCFQKQFLGLLTLVAQTVLGPSARAVLTVDASLALEHNTSQAGASAVSVKPPVPAPRPQAMAAPAVPAPAQTAPPPGPGIANPGLRQRRLASLGEFIPSPATQIAATAARHAADFPAAQFNPLFFYGAVGTGKTHLLEGICRELRNAQPNRQVVLITAEGFANYFTQALRDRTLPSFRQRFRSVDSLLIDDIDFFESKRVFQEEFLHTVVELIDHGRQVVATGD